MKRTHPVDGMIQAMSANANLYFFTGENSFALSQEVRRWKDAFAAKYGQENLERLDGSKQTAMSLMDAVASMPFIGEKRLVLCDTVPKLDKEELKNVLEAMHPQTILAIVDSKPDKRLTIVKELAQHAQVKSFPPLTASQLQQWIAKQVSECKTIIEPAAVTLLLELVGTDPWMLHTEIAKLAVHAQGTITAADVQLLAVASGTQVIWRLTDLLGAGITTDALTFFRTQVDRGEDPYGMWVVLLNAIRTIAGIRMALDAGISQERSIAQAIDVHFFSVRGLLPVAKSLSTQQVRTLVNWTAGADLSLKTGGYHYTVERPAELLSLAERVITLCSVQRK